MELIPLTYLEGPWGALPQKLALVAYLEGNSATVYLIDRFRMEKVRELMELWPRTIDRRRDAGSALLPL